jgi:hypothetical protein
LPSDELVAMRNYFIQLDKQLGGSG